MAILKTSQKVVDVPDGSPIIDVAKQLGVPFGCHAGMCGTCLVDIEEGMDNLAPYSLPEQEMGLQGKQRLCCQAYIEQGVVEIKF